MYQKVAQFIVRYRVAIAALLLAVTLIFVWQLRNLKVNNELDIWIGNNQVEYNIYRDYVANFGNDESTVLVIVSDSIFTTGFLSRLHQLTDTLSLISGVTNVTGLTTISIPVLSAAGAYEIPLVPYGFQNPDKIRTKVEMYRSVHENLMSEDRKATLVEVQTHDSIVVEKLPGVITKLAEEVIADYGTIVPFGVAPVKSEINELSTSEAAIYFSLALVVMVIFIRLLYKRFVPGLLAITIATVSIIWILGLMSALGVTINILLSSMPVLLLVISIAFSAHLITAIEEFNDGESDPVDVLSSVYSKVFVNCMFSAGTTAIALYVFTITSITPLCHFGIFAGTGVLLSFVFNFLLFSLFYSFSSKPYSHRIAEKRWESLFLFINFLTLRYEKSIFFVAALLAGIAVVGITKLEINTDQKTYLKKENKVRQNIERAESLLNGVVPIEVVFYLAESIYDNFAFYDQKFSDIENLLASMPEIKSRMSYRMVADDFFSSIDGLGSLFYITPEIVGENKVLQRFISEDGKMVRITLKADWLSDNGVLQLADKIERNIGSLVGGSNFIVKCTGAMPIFAVMGKRLIFGQIQSVLLAFLTIFLVFIFIYRSLKWPFMAMLPNILPVVITLGIMGFTNIKIDVATVLVASVSFGIAVDDTIHFTKTYRKLLKLHPNKDVVALSFETTGKPLVITSLLLASGFLLLAFSNYRPLIFLGVFLSINVILALLFDLLLLPALIRVTASKTKQNP